MPDRFFLLLHSTKWVFNHTYKTVTSLGISYNRKEVFHPQVLLRIPCYDLSPIIGFALGPQKRGTSGTPNFRALTGGEYKTQEHIHRTIADMRLLAIPTSRGRVADLDPN